MRRRRTDATAHLVEVIPSRWDDTPAERARAMLAGYEAHRPLSPAERAALPVLAHGAAMRFFLTRLHDWGATPPGALVRPKDPLEYERKLAVHRSAPDLVLLGYRGMFHVVPRPGETAEEAWAGGVESTLSRLRRLSRVEVLSSLTPLPFMPKYCVATPGSDMSTCTGEVEGDEASVSMRILGQQTGMMQARFELVRHGADWRIRRLLLQRGGPL